MNSQPKSATLFDLDAAELDLLARLEAVFEGLAESEDATRDPGAESERIVDEHLAALDEVQEQLGAKLIGYIKAIRAKRARAALLEAEAALYQAEANRLAARAHDADDTAEFLSSRLKAFMERRELTEFEAGTFRLKITKQGGKLPVIIAPGVKAEDVDERFHRVIPARVEFDKAAIETALKAGEKLETEAPADYLIGEGEARRVEWARLGERATKLKIG